MMRHERVESRLTLARRAVFGALAGAGLALSASGALADDHDTLTMAIPADLGGWDQDYLAFDLVGLAVMKNTYPYAIDYSVMEVGGGQIHDTENVLPLYAESWESNADGTVWTLKLRQGIKFPSGNELTAHDVKWSKDRALAAQANVAGIYRVIGLTEQEQIEVVDDYTVRFTQSQPSALTSQIQIISLYVFDSELAKANATDDDPWAKEWMNQTPPLGGAFNVTSYTPGEEIVLEANPDFPGETGVSKVRMQVIPAAANRRLLLQNGAVDIALGLPRRDVQDLASADGVKVISSPSNEFVFIPMNTAQAPFDNATVRKAMAHAVPYDAIIRSVYNDDARASTSVVPLDMPGHSPAGYPFDHDPEKAKTLLAEAGFGDGFETSIVIAANNPEQERLAVILQAAFADVGVTLEIETLDPATMQQRRQERSIPMQVASGQMWVNDIEYLLSVALTEGGFLNYANYNSAEINEIFGSLAGELDPDKRSALFARTQEVLAEEVPWLMLAQPNFVLPVSETVSGWVQPVDGLFRLKHLSK